MVRNVLKLWHLIYEYFKHFIFVPFFSYYGWLAISNFFVLTCIFLKQTSQYCFMRNLHWCTTSHQLKIILLFPIFFPSTDIGQHLQSFVEKLYSFLTDIVSIVSHFRMRNKHMPGPCTLQDLLTLLLFIFPLYCKSVVHIFLIFFSRHMRRSLITMVFKWQILIIYSTRLSHQINLAYRWFTILLLDIFSAILFKYN